VNASNERPVAVQGYFVPTGPDLRADMPGLREIWSELLRHKWLIGGAAVIGASVALAAALLSDPVYKATAVVKVTEPADRPGGLGNLANQLGGLAALAGVKVPGGGDRSEAVAVLKSQEVAAGFIAKHQLLPELYPRKWDAAAKTWKSKEPRLPLAIKKFSRSMRDVVEDKATGLILVSIRGNSPQRAAALANDLVSVANDRLRLRAIDEAARSMRFLDAEMQKTTNVQLQRTIAEMMQSQLNTAMLANVRSEYALQTLDPAMAPDRTDQVWPRPALLAAVGLFVGLLLGALFVIGRRAWQVGSAPVQSVTTPDESGAGSSLR
jgi:uncharacterized protein involved in exopolysaccharide biosynthesis